MRPPLALALIFLAAVLAIYLGEPIFRRFSADWPAQWPAYHDFADQRGVCLCGGGACRVPNFGDVASNLPFLIPGIAGLIHVFRRRRGLPWIDTWGTASFFASVGLVALGSGYYHWSPSNGTLMWDRLPMAPAFASLFAMVLADRLSPRLGARLLIPIQLASVASVLYWHASELRGSGDLRPYALAQFFPIAIIAGLLILRRPARLPGGRELGLTAAFYIGAKLLESLDKPIFGATGELVSGHTLKHLSAALATWFAFRWVRSWQGESWCRGDAPAARSTEL